MKLASALFDDSHALAETFVFDFFRSTFPRMDTGVFFSNEELAQLKLVISVRHNSFEELKTYIIDFHRIIRRFKF